MSRGPSQDSAVVVDSVEGFPGGLSDPAGGRVATKIESEDLVAGRGKSAERSFGLIPVPCDLPIAVNTSEVVHTARRICGRAGSFAQRQMAASARWTSRV